MAKNELRFSKKIRLRNDKPTIKQLDALAREIVRERDKMKCRMCGKTTFLQCAHVYSRAKRSVRWDLDNLFLLCAGCHMNIAHKDPIGFAEWVKSQLGDKKFNDLKMRAHQVSKIDLQCVKLYLEKTKGEINGN